MKRLSNISEETVALGLRFGISYLQIYEIPSKHDLRITETGRSIPAFVGPAAKVLLSQSNDKELEKIMKVIKLEKMTENTITDKDVFLEQVREARSQGFALSYGERIPGAIGISAPILNYQLPSAMTILAFEYRVKPRIKELTGELLISTRRISKNLAEFSS
jgi:DNA-binding IclR family transcriptional regulator